MSQEIIVQENKQQIFAGNTVHVVQKIAILSPLKSKQILNKDVQIRVEKAAASALKNTNNRDHLMLLSKNLIFTFRKTKRNFSSKPHFFVEFYYDENEATSELKKDTHIVVGEFFLFDAKRQFLKKIHRHCTPQITTPDK